MDEPRTLTAGLVLAWEPDMSGINVGEDVRPHVMPTGWEIVELTFDGAKYRRKDRTRRHRDGGARARGWSRVAPCLLLTAQPHADVGRPR